MRSLADLREGKEVICRMDDIRAYDCAKMSQHSKLQVIVAYEGELKVDQKQSEIWSACILYVYLGCGLRHTGDSRADASSRRERTNTGAGSHHSHFADRDPRASNTDARTHPVPHPNPPTNDHTHPYTN